MSEVTSNNSQEQLLGNELSADAAIKVEGVRVAYRTYQDRPTSLKESVVKFLRTGKFRYYSTFDALKDISFEVKKGEVFGILGSNGAGKSTLLSVLAGVLPPTEGSLYTRGTIDSLIQLGAGFDPDLTAIENIYLYGSLRKRTIKDLKTRVDWILDFAELSDFANTPIKYYSSGMFARLGFAVAIDSDPDILIVDEVLAVGDERFRIKCEGVFHSLIEKQKTIVMVSHDLNSLKKLCNRIALLQRGQVIYLGEPEGAVAKYLDGDYQTRLH